MRWRVGTKVTINVYEGDRPVCQCHTAIDAKRIVEAMNAFESGPPRRLVKNEHGHFEIKDPEEQP